MDTDAVEPAQPGLQTRPALPEPVGLDPNDTLPKAGKRERLSETLVHTAASTATKLLPLLELLERIRPHMENDSVFTSRRDKLNAQMALAYAQLKADKPKHEALVEAFRLLGEFVLEESREVSKDEVKESAKRFVLATLKHAPGLINAAHQARLLS
ncbi:hypothetical protein [Hymenobacter persicinus]|uniref:Uncharacterized protein n=1 Tax=Hymenobacter persicinus TaxID=2025506 RepID=A0A4Q5L9P2_9BACT|nr:hypothetical protein [Hymenobacter persicinus]RYU77218.1 hypothetical protein EWM57_17510 [Hymenobacter persicinus]